MTPCDTCHRETTNLYWNHPRTGKRMQRPLCRECYEDAVRGVVRDRDELAELRRGAYEALRGGGNG